MADSPVAYWRLGESSGLVATDESGNGLHSTYINGVTLGAPGGIAGDSNTAASFDGVDDRLSRAPVTTQLDNITLEAWVYWAGCCNATGGPLIVYNGHTGANGYGLQISSGGGQSCGPASQLHVLLGGQTCNAAGSGGAVPLNQWAHVAATRRSGNVWAIYVNGVKRTERSTSPGPNPITSGGTAIGDEFDGVGGAGQFQGRIDEVAVYNTALTPARIQAHFEAGGGTPAPPPGQSIGHCGGVGAHANSGSSCQDDPVNSLTGAFTTSAVDLRLPGIGVPFSWQRSYTSADATSGRLGPGWTDRYATSLAIQGNGDVLLHGDEGQQVYYTKQVDNSFLGAPGALSTMTQVAGGYKLVRRDQVVYLFDTQGRLTSVRDRNNQGLSFAYDGSGQLQTVTDSVGRQIVVTHAGGLLSRVTLPDGRYVEYTYVSGRLSSVRDARGGTTQYTYDTGGRLKTIADQNLHTVVDNTYGTDGRVTQQINARGKTGTFSWNATTQTQTYTDARQNKWKDVYADGLLVERIDPLGNTTSFEYDAGLNVKKVTGARGNATTMTYDARGNMLTRTAPAPLSYGEEWTFNARNDPLTYKDRRANTTDFGYDASGNLTSLTAPDADGPGPLGRPQTLYGRDPAGTGLLTSVTDPRGKQTTFTYTNGNLTEIRTQLANKTTMGYDGSGRMTSLVDPRGNASGANPADYTWTYTYNEWDQLRTQTDPLGNVTELEYDSAGNITSREDAKMHVTSFGYDEANHLTSVTAPDPDGGGPLAAPVTQYTYDDVGNLATRKDANLRETAVAPSSCSRESHHRAPQVPNSSRPSSSSTPDASLQV